MILQVPNPSSQLLIKPCKDSGLMVRYTAWRWLAVIRCLDFSCFSGASINRYPPAFLGIRKVQ
jgi:hypothetical protein